MYSVSGTGFKAAECLRWRARPAAARNLTHRYRGDDEERAEGKPCGPIAGKIRVAAQWAPAGA